MTTHNYLFVTVFFLLVVCLSCVSVQQQVADSENAKLNAKIEGFVGPLIIDEAAFHDVASFGIYDRLDVNDEFLPSNNKVMYAGTFGGRLVYIRDCKCIGDAEIIQDKLVVTHTYGGGESNRENTVLLWDGTYYQNAKGEFMVDLILENQADFRRAAFRERKVLDVAAVQVKGVDFVWINLIGYDQLIRYAYNGS